MAELRVIVNFNKTARYAFNVLVGALEAKIADGRMTLLAARNHQELLALLGQAGDCQKTLVLWSFYSPQFIEVSERVKDARRIEGADNVIHLAGGVHASAEPWQTLRAGFDYVAVGEGEQIIVDVVQALLHDESLESVQGIAWLEGERWRRNGRGGLVDLNDFPPFAPKFHLFGAIEITRGCVYACKFCQTPYASKARFRHRSIEQVARYATIMRAEGFRDFRFLSPTALSYGSEDESVDLDAVGRLLAATRQAVGADGRIFFGSFPSELRPEHVTREALRLLKRYVNNDNLIIGGQSGSQKVLDSSRRGHSVDSIVSAVRLCRDEGFVANVDFLLGLPGEDTEDIRQTLDLAQELSAMGARIHNHSFMPLPGTPFRRADAGAIDAYTQTAIVQMEVTGKAYGKWRAHMETAQALVRLREDQTHSA